MAYGLWPTGPEGRVLKRTVAALHFLPRATAITGKARLAPVRFRSRRDHMPLTRDAQMSSYLDQIKWNDHGLVPVTTQDAVSGRLLTQAWINREALEVAVEENRAVYWSRSRAKLWRKGEESGNIQQLVEVLLDCDNDSVCYRVKQIGGIACHTGRESCFYKRLSEGSWLDVDPVLKDPAQMYNKVYSKD